MASSRPLFLRSISSLRRRPSQPHLVQCNKQILELARLGRVADARRLFDGMPHRDAVTWNSMITAYVQGDHLKEAKSLFDVFRSKNVRTWTILLSGYVNKGLMQEAFSVFESMPERNVVSWNVMVNGFVQCGELRRARRLFDEMPERNVSSWNTMVMGYCWCGLLEEAQELFDKMGERDSISWAVLISGYAEAGQYREAWYGFRMMVRSGLSVDQPVLVVTVSCLVGLSDLEALESFRVVAIKTGFDADVVVGTAILNAYTRVGRLDEAVKLFEALPKRNEYTWTAMIAAFTRFHRLDDAVSLYEQIPDKCISVKTSMASAYARCGRIHEARWLFDEIKDRNVLTWNAMLGAYAENGMLQQAEDIFREMPLRNATSWSALLSGFVHNGKSREALEFFSKLHSSGTFPNHFSLTSSLFACAEIGDIETGRQIHALTIKRRCQFNCFVGNALISMYAKCKNVRDSSYAFDSMKVRDIVSWNSLISGASENWMLEDARFIFERMPMRDSVSWAAIISAYEQAGLGGTALRFFKDMMEKAIGPTELAVTSLLTACGKLGHAHLGKQIHAMVVKLGFSSFLFISNSLSTMYFKCGGYDGFRIFQEMRERDIISWNVAIAGCAHNGLGQEAVEMFEQMKIAGGVCPDEVSFLGVLSACSRAGLADKGEALFNSMTEEYGIRPSVYHYTCMVKLLRQMGRLNEARAIVENMPEEADSVVWEALLNASRHQHDLELGRKVSNQLLETGTEKYNLRVPIS